MDLSSRVLVRKIIIDITCFAFVGLTVLMLFLFGQPYRRGFFCNDESLAHPFHESTVTSWQLYIGGIFIPLVVMLLGEFLFAKNSNGQASIVLFGRVISPWVLLAYHKIGLFGFGAVTNIFVTDIAKYSIGRLRPHFINVCNPTINCNLPENQHIYHVNDFTCNSTFPPRLLKEVRLSFPSGHSSFSAYVMIYLALYLQLRITWKGSKLLKHLVQLICLMLAWYTAMSRVSDYKHHWSDVLAGLLIGTIVSLVMVFGVADMFKDQRKGATSPVGGSVTVMGGLGTNGDSHHRSGDYDAETAMQAETSPLRGIDNGLSYGGIPMTQSNL